MARFGTATLDAGGTFRAFGTGNTVVIPDTPTYDKTGATDITSAIQDLIAQLPNSTRLRCQPNATYRCEKTLLFDGTRTGGFKNILFDGRGATFKATNTYPYSSGVGVNRVVSNCTVGAPTWTIGPNIIKTVTAAAGTTPFGPLVNTVYSWYVTAAGVNARTQGARTDTTPDVPAPTSTVIHIIAHPEDLPANGVTTLTFTSPADRNRANFQFDNIDDIVIRDLDVVGANTAWAGFNATLEAQSGLYFTAGCDGIEVKGCTINNQWGDNITLQSGSGTPLKNVSLHDNVLHHATRQSIAIGGLIDADITRNVIRDSHRHLVDVEPNGGNQTCQRINFHNNDFLRGGLGLLAISAYGGLPMFIGDFWFTNNRITDTLNIPVGTNHNQPATQPRWGPFTFTNNIATVPFGTGGTPPSWVSGHAYAQDDRVTDGITVPDTFWQCKVAVTSTVRPHLDPTHWRTVSIWDGAPGLIKFQYCDDITVTGNICQMAAGRLMYAVWAETSTGIHVHDNHDFTATDSFVSPHFELFATLYNVGFGTLDGGGTFTASGVSVPSTKGSAQFDGGGDFSATGRGINYGTASLDCGGVFSAVGFGKSYGTATLDGGGDFSANGLGQNFGAALFDGGGTFNATGRGVTFATGTFEGGGTFTAVGQSQTYGTATFDAGGTFVAVGISHLRGRGTFDGGGTFSAQGKSEHGHHQDEDWTVGTVKLRQPGWDETRWDTRPWDGKE